MDEIFRHLSDKGVAVWRDTNELNAGSDFAEQIAQAILSSDCFMPVLTRYRMASQFVKHEIAFAIETAEKRNKQTTLLTVIISIYANIIKDSYQGKFPDMNLFRMFDYFVAGWSASVGQ